MSAGGVWIGECVLLMCCWLVDMLDNIWEKMDGKVSMFLHLHLLAAGTI